jgi:hypothetical protein
LGHQGSAHSHTSARVRGPTPNCSIASEAQASRDVFPSAGHKLLRSNDTLNRDALFDRFDPLSLLSGSGLIVRKEKQTELVERNLIWLCVIFHHVTKHMSPSQMAEKQI